MFVSNFSSKKIIVILRYNKILLGSKKREDPKNLKKYFISIKKVLSFIHNYLIKKDSNSYGNLTLACGSHPHNNLDVKDPSDFDKRPNGGCQLPCPQRLECGHFCTLKCHTFDHAEYKCPKNCDKIIEKSDKRCQMKCQHEGNCSFKVTRNPKVIDSSKSVDCTQACTSLNSHIYTIEKGGRAVVPKLFSTVDPKKY